MSIIRVIKKFQKILSTHQKLRIAELAVLMVIGGVLELCSVSLVLPFMSAVLNPEEVMGKWYVQSVCNMFGIESASTFLIFLSIVLAVIYILKNIYLLFEYDLQYRFTYGNMLVMQRRLLHNFIHRPYEYFLKVNSGEMIRIVNTDTADSFYMLTVLLEIFTETIVAIMLLIGIFVITPTITMGMAAVLLIMLFVIMRTIKPILYKVGLENQASAAGMNKWLLQAIQGIKELKIMNKEKFFQENFETYGSTYVNSLQKNQILLIVPKFFIEAISMSTMFIIVALLIYNGSSLETIVPMLTAVAMAAMRLLPSINRISNSMGAINYREPKLDKLMEYLAEIEDRNELHPADDKERSHEVRSREEKPFEENIKLEQVSYHYPDSDVNILEAADLKIKKGQSVGIVGPSGAGKTTMIDILLGLLKPGGGRVMVDGIDIEKDITNWHEQIGYIPQTIFMLDDTIRANVAFGIEKKDILDENVWESLEEASLADFVRSLPEGLDTEIGERGVRLSGGQRQRLGIARALYYKPDVLIFDEATSALDRETEAAVMESINKLHGQKTMIIIAHRLSTIEKCDHIYKVENGKIELER
ncbi:protein glycosylation K [Lachnospiraceae bacterium]|nr:protein glycosylation K [Lachnospiraceae bacterium]